MTNINSPKLLVLYLEWLAQELEAQNLDIDTAKQQINTLHATGDLQKLKTELIKIASAFPGFLLKINSAEQTKQSEDEKTLSQKLQNLFLQKPELTTQIINEYLTKSSSLTDILAKYPELSN